MLGLIMAATLSNAPFLRFNLDVREFGMHGTGTILVDRLDGRYVRTYDVGAASDSEGYDGTNVWMADAANSTYVQGNADTRARALRWSGLYRTLGTAPALPSVSIRVGPDTEHTTFSDVRCLEANFCVPFAMTIRDQEGERVVRVRGIDALQHVAANAFQPPPLPNDASVDSPSGVTSVAFSPERLHGRLLPLVVLVVRVNGSGSLRFLLDTGGQNIITPAVAKNLGIVTSGGAQVGGAGSGTISNSFAWVDRVRIGGAEMRRQPFTVLSLGDILPDIDGIVGAELLSRFGARFDFVNARLDLARTVPPSWSAGTTVSPIAFDKNTPDMAGTSDGFAGRFTLDTGSDGALDLNAPFAARNGLYAYYGAKRDGAIGGVGGAVATARVRVKRLVLGASAVSDVKATLAYPAAESVSSDPTIAGNIGEQVLRRWNVMVLDYRTLIIGLR
jgi:predicted aspartyl protease